MNPSANMALDLRPQHQKQIKQLELNLSGNTEKLRVKKKTVSNLFRYSGRQSTNRREVDLSGFNKPLFLDKKNKTLEAQGLTTFEQIVDFLLPLGFLPLITPELKHITLGGAIVGIGIESNTYRYGFVHNGLIEADILLPDGQVVTCSADNKYKDLFYALPNSYGTFGYVLRAKIKLRKVLPYMKLSTKRYNNSQQLLDALKSAVDDPKNDSVESMTYSKNRLYLTTVRQASTPVNLMSIYANTIFYKEISKVGQISLKTRDFIFRYDPEWFWNLPDSKAVSAFRRIAPQSIRNSSFYAKYARLTSSLPRLSGMNNNLEELIQDWEVPLKHAESLLEFVLDNVDLCGKPLMLALIKVPKAATLYPMKENQLYLNLGSYSFVKRKPNRERYYNTQIIDRFCFAHDGIKMLYSSTFLTKSDFDRIYNGKAYSALKKKYDPLGLLPTLFEKAVKSH